MSSKKLHLILVGVICLLFVGLVAGAYGINNLLASESKKLTGLKARSQALAQEQAGLIKAKKSIAKYTELEKITRSVVPEDKNQAEAVREIVNIAASNDISLSAINFPASTLGNTPGGGAAKTPAATPAPTASSGSSKTLSQLQPVKSITGVYQLPITVSSSTSKPVPYGKFISFLSALEHNRRTAQVSSITLQPDPKNPNSLSFTLILNEYIKP